MKTIVIATDSFKGSASSQEVAENLQRGLTAANPSLKIKKVPLADGGEGTVTAIVNATKGHLISTRVSGLPAVKSTLNGVRLTIKRQ
ncbi:glycerate kinase [Lentilactobacillus buchneri]|uniref:glycerate kinase n=1 Tax=Lentilactobacillus buchneri TaxID=1581 RepID=UPI0038575C79